MDQHGEQQVEVKKVLVYWPMALELDDLLLPS
jgi:hypothetical protein